MSFVCSKDTQRFAQAKYFGIKLFIFKKHSGFGPENYSFPNILRFSIMWVRSDFLAQQRKDTFRATNNFFVVITCIQFYLILYLLPCNLLPSWPPGIPPLLQSRFVGSSTLHLVSGQGQSIEGFPQLFSVWD